jgi:uncharacterized protein (DUF1330 family)
MAACVNITVTDPERYAEYVKVVPATIAKYGGRYLARGGRAEVLEGTWAPQRLVVLEFDSLDRARAWWESDDYSGPKLLRRSAAVADIILVEGIAPPEGAPRRDGRPGGGTP